jgi:hypothetical protein
MWSFHIPPMKVGSCPSELGCPPERLSPPAHRFPRKESKTAWERGQELHIHMRLRGPRLEANSLLGRREYTARIEVSHLLFRSLGPISGPSG